MGVKKLARNLYLLGGSPSTLIILNEEAWIVDPGMGGEERCREIRGFLERKEVEKYRVYATHAHPDHIASAPCMQRPLHIHGLEASLAASSLLRDTVIYGARAPKNLFTLKAGDVAETIPMGWDERLGDCRTLGLPGHSAGHSGVICEDREALHAADAVFGERLLDRVGIPFFSDYSSALRSMELVAEYASAGYRIAMGHGPVVRGGRAVELVEANLARLRDMPRVIKGLLEKPMSVGELAYRASRLMGAEPGVEGLILNEVPVKAVLSYLVDEGVVEPLASERGVLWARRN